MKVHIELDEKLLRKLILEYIQSKLGDVNLTEDSISIQVKSKQSFKSEWETAAFRAEYEGIL